LRKGQAVPSVKKVEIKAKADSIRLPSGGDEPPTWSKKLKTYKRNSEQFYSSYMFIHFPGLFKAF
jgi:hypothetical protein